MSTFVSCSLFDYLFDDSTAIEETTTIAYVSTTTTTLDAYATTTSTTIDVSTTLNMTTTTDAYAPTTSTTIEETTTTIDAYVSTTTTLDAYVSTTIEETTTTTTVGPTGGADINITLNIPESGTIDVSGDLLELHEGATMSIEVIAFFTADSYRWFLNGDELSGENSATINIGSSLYLGEYILSVEIKRSNQYYSHNVFFSVIR